MIMRLSGSMSILGGLLILLAGCQQCVSADCDIEAPPEVAQDNGGLYAACKLRPSSTLAEGLPKVYGQVLFRQDYPQGALEVILRVSGLQCNEGPRAVHIHQYGDLSQGCASAGGHYNPHGVNHPLHPGDFGNFESQKGKINTMIQANATLFGGLSVIGRSVVIHEKRDDLGLGGDAASLANGNAGQRLGCCIIGISTPNLWMVNVRRVRKN